MPPSYARLWPPFAAVLTGGLLTLMVTLNGRLAVEGTALFSSLAAHGTGTFAAACVLLALGRTGRRGARPGQGKAPLWAYLGGVSGAVTVILTSSTVNTSLALSGTLALGLAGQVVFGLVADTYGLFGLPVRRPDSRDMAALCLISAGCLILIYFGRGAV